MYAPGVTAPARIESALLVPVPEATALIGEHRLRLDPAAAAGVPEHVTLLYPFLHPEKIGPAVHARLSAIFCEIPPFRFCLREVAWFGEEVMWLRPEPALPFKQMTELLVAEFGLLPYGGVHDEVVPHLTIAQGQAGEGRRISPGISSGLPIEATADRVHLMVSSEQERWSLVDQFTLGA
jgi:2'-5' RNA ligase